MLLLYVLVILFEGFSFSNSASFFVDIFNPLAPSDPCMGRTALLTSRCCILNIYSTNIRTEYFKCAA
jgi:hypothetical protein